MMDTLKMHSLDGVQRNIELIGKLFPNAITEVKRDGKVEHAIDFDVLRQELSDSIVEGREERYQFTWPDKKKAMLAANAPITATLRPVVADSVGKDGTPGGFDSENLYIEGDNLEVLKLLQETYLGKVKMIYIDPPYNTGNDFVYNDEFGMRDEEWNATSGNYDDEGNQIVGALEKNTESNGRFHTDWLNMIYPRLKIAKNLLTDDGLIFLSIDDNEMVNLSKICDEIFGESNFIAQMIWKSKPQGGNDNKYIIAEHEYILVYAKNINFVTVNGKPHTSEKYTKQDEYFAERGLYATAKLDLSTLGYRVNLDYPIECPDGSVVYPGNVTEEQWKKRKNNTNANNDWQWRWSKDRFARGLQMGLIEFRKNGDQWNVYTKEYEKMDYDGNIISRTVKYRTVIDNVTTINGTTEISSLLANRVFAYPKPVELIKSFCSIATEPESIVLDFFSGSATTAHAVMKLNAEDGGHRKFIMVQLPEKTDEKSEAYKAGYKNICEIGKERIRRAGRKIKEDAGLTAPADLDIGFRCLRLDESNMKPVYYTPDEIGQQDLFSLVDNVKEDRTPEDLLFQVMLDLGVLLSSPIEVKEIAGKKVFNVADGFLMACFDHDVTEETVKAIAQMKPYYAVFRDSSMANDSVATNFDQIFETYSPETVRKVL